MSDVEIVRLEAHLAGIAIKPTERALERWNERFSGRCLITEYKRARRIKKRLLGRMWDCMPTCKNNCKFKMTRDGIVSVLSQDNAIVTVLRFN